MNMVSSVDEEDTFQEEEGAEELGVQLTSQAH